MPNDASSHPQLFHCPNCGAGLPMPDTTSVECEYCGSKILVPPEYLPEIKDENVLEPVYYSTVVQIDTQPEAPSGSSGRSAARVVLFIVILIAVLGLGFFILVAAGIVFTTSKVNTQVDQISTTMVSIPTEFFVAIPTFENLPEIISPTASSIANLALQFGGEGSGPGQFLDPRQITVDSDGNIYVADFNSGRIQKFDSNGKFIQMWMVEPGHNQNSMISDLAADYSGRLYAIRSGDIQVFTEESQEPTAVFEGDFPETYYNALAVDPANNLYALAHGLSGDDLVKLNQDGQELQRVNNIVYTVDKNTPPQSDVIAVDGLGNTYFLSVFNPQIFKYDSSGQYADRLGSPGKNPGQFEHPSRLATDGQGRIYILDNWAIIILDQNGSFLESIAWDYSLGSPRDIALDINGGLYIVTSQGQVLKYNLIW